MDDRRVVAAGEDAALDQLHERLRAGPAHARVEAVERDVEPLWPGLREPPNGNPASASPMTRPRMTQLARTVFVRFMGSSFLLFRVDFGRSHSRSRTRKSSGVWTWLRSGGAERPNSCEFGYPRHIT